MSAVPSRTKMGQWRIFGKLKSWTWNFKSINPELSFVVKRIAAKSSSPAPGLVVCGVFLCFWYFGSCMKGEQGFTVLSHSRSYLSGGLPVLEGLQGNKKRFELLSLEDWCDLFSEAALSCLSQSWNFPSLLPSLHKKESFHCSVLQGISSTLWTHPFPWGGTKWSVKEMTSWRAADLQQEAESNCLGKSQEPSLMKLSLELQERLEMAGDAASPSLCAAGAAVNSRA